MRLLDCAQGGSALFHVLAFGSDMKTYSMFIYTIFITRILIIKLSSQCYSSSTECSCGKRKIFRIEIVRLDSGIKNITIYAVREK
jgi:hypothetical protein